MNVTLNFLQIFSTMFERHVSRLKRNSKFFVCLHCLTRKKQYGKRRQQRKPDKNAIATKAWAAGLLDIKTKFKT